MKNRGVSLVVYFIIGLAAVGLITQLVGNTSRFLTQIVFMVGMGALFLGAFYFVFVRKRTNSDETKKYKQAVKQSRQKYNQEQKSNYQKAVRKQSSSKQKRPSKKRTSHLRVIEGNKSKSKKRASN
ncbi:hypothetical protein JNUCC1_03547 [Lentibacillus sp. JNUCC-1]|uniref:SA1362 family protein n=1 Tax=Lentibacillus sp. JNUCC-1 TaxID=2654513 RepID=UPI0012E83877|nr:SA1362 family protein [Lentibacillus sp. JNUCC-1]MUV39663.1 hypothetical protein [Lentibacillus sp. JNUCC-1]